MGSSVLSPILFGVSFLIGYLFWKNAIRSVIFWLLVEGAIRKWVWPAGHVTIYFLKDFLLAGAFVRWMLFRAAPRRRGFNLDLLGLYLGMLGMWCLFEVFNPNSPRVLIGIMGLKTYIFYAFLIYAMPELFESKEDLLRYLRRYAYCAIPILIFGIVQFFSPAHSVLTENLGWNPNTRVTIFGGVGHFATWVRISSTFAYLTEYSGYLTVLALLCMALIQVRGSKGKAIYYFVAVLTGLNLVMTGSRGPVILVLMGYGLFLTMTGRISTGKFLGVLARMGWLAAITALVIAIQFPDSFGAFMERVKHERDVPARFTGSFVEPVERIVQAGLIGYGLGTTHPATMFLVTDEAEWGSMPRDFEQEPGRVALETAHTHLVFYWCFAGLGLSLPRLDERLKDPATSPMPTQNIPYTHAA